MTECEDAITTLHPFSSVPLALTTSTASERLTCHKRFCAGRSRASALRWPQDVAKCQGRLGRCTLAQAWPKTAPRWPRIGLFSWQNRGCCCLLCRHARRVLRCSRGTKGTRVGGYGRLQVASHATALRRPEQNPKCCVTHGFELCIAIDPTWLPSLASDV